MAGRDWDTVEHLRAEIDALKVSAGVMKHQRQTLLSACRMALKDAQRDNRKGQQKNPALVAKLAGAINFATRKN